MLRSRGSRNVAGTLFSTATLIRALDEERS